MKKKILIINLIMFVLIFLATVNAFAEWRVSSSEDEMTGEKQYYAMSPSVKSTESMGFPYSSTNAWLGVGTDGDQEWCFIGFSETPNLTDASTKDGYNLIDTRIKWNDDSDKIENTKLTQSWGAKFLHFRSDEDIISKIEESNTLLIELGWYGEGDVYFDFSLKGSAAAINEIRNKFE